MRKTLVALTTTGLALLLASVGTAASPQTVTISASRPSVVFGKSVTLSGKVSNSKAGENVSVLAGAVRDSGLCGACTCADRLRRSLV